MLLSLSFFTHKSEEAQYQIERQQAENQTDYYAFERRVASCPSKDCSNSAYYTYYHSNQYYHFKHRALVVYT